MKEKPVLVTTEFRGIFFGFVIDDSRLPERITLTNVRSCLTWSEDIGGFLGLASKGPSPECTIGDEAGEVTFFKITSVASVSEEAVKRWKEWLR